MDFDPFEPAGLITDRRAVRIALMRGTVHLVTAQDCPALRPVVQPVLSRSLRHARFGRAAPPGAAHGFVAASYRIDRWRGAAVLVVDPVAPLTKAATAAVTGEGARLLRFVAAQADTHDVRINPAG